MKKYILYQIDSFTRTKFKGNPAGVVVNADGLSEKHMQSIARELNNSETAFLFSPDNDDCDGIIRYFTPTTEVPICGHATIAAMYAKALEEKTDTCVFNYKTGVGVLPFKIIRIHDEYKIMMTQGTIKIDEPLDESSRNELFIALGITTTDLDKRCPVQIASTGHSKVMIGINSRKKLNNLVPDFSGLSRLSKKINCNGYYVFTLDSEEEGILTHGRMFAPAVGIPEDPVTGNANGPLGAYLIYNGIVHPETATGTFAFTAKQGEKIGREGTIEVAVEIKDKKPVTVRIFGEAVVVFKTVLEL